MLLRMAPRTLHVCNDCSTKKYLVQAKLFFVKLCCVLSPFKPLIVLGWYFYDFSILNLSISFALKALNNQMTMANNSNDHLIGLVDMGRSLLFHDSPLPTTSDHLAATASASPSQISPLPQSVYCQPSSKADAACLSTTPNSAPVRKPQSPTL